MAIPPGGGGSDYEAIIKGLQATIRSLQDQLNIALAERNSLARRANDSIVGTITGAIGGAWNAATGAIGSAASAARDLIGGAVGAARSAIGSAVETIGGAAGSLLNTARIGLSGVITFVRDRLGEALSMLGPALASIGDLLKAGLGVVLGQVGQYLAAAAKLVNEHVGGILSAVNPVIGGVLDALAALPGGISEVAGEVLRGLPEALLGAGPDIFGAAVEVIGGAITASMEGGEATVYDRYQPIINRALANPKLPSDVRAALAPPVKGRDQWQLAVGLGIGIGVTMGVLGGIVGPISQVVEQDMLKAIRPTRLSLPDLISGYYREVVDAGHLYDSAARQGYEDADIGRAIEITRPLLAPAELVSMAQREIISPDERDARMLKAGWDPFDVRLIAEYGKVLPGVQDLVRFVVRESLPGQSAYGGAAGASVPGSFVEEAKHLGLDEQWARSFWAAHWQLPSLGDVFDMFHRRLIDLDTLKTYLVVADVMPEWRERIIAVAYQPLTRVDVRRMYSLGVLDESGVTSAYLDLGYSPENAALMTRFTVEYETASRRTAADPERDLTKADLIGAYRDGVLTREETGGYLAGLGYDATESETLLGRADLAEAGERRRAFKANVTDLVIGGHLTLEAAQDRMRASGLTTDEVAILTDEITAKLEVAAARAAPKPPPTISRADLFRMHKSRIISGEELAAELAAIGYEGVNLERLLALAKTGLAPLD